MKILISPHAQERLKERGVSEREVYYTVQHGEQFEAKFNRKCFRCNFSYDAYWNDKKYAFKQVEVYAVKSEQTWIVITAMAKYF